MLCPRHQSEVVPGLDGGKRSSQNSLNCGKLHLSELRKGHLVKLGTLDVVKLVPKETPVHVRELGFLLDVVALFDGKGHDIAMRLLTNDIDVPLQEEK